MKFKTLFAAMLTAMGSSAVLAQDYQVEAGLAYTDFDGSDAIDFLGEVHFNTVKTEGHALEEAAFVERSNNLKLQYSDADGSDTYALAVEAYFADLLYASVGYTDVEYDGGFDFDTTIVRLGVTPAKGLRIATTYYDEIDYEFNLDLKYVTALSEGTFLNFEASYEDGGDFDDTFAVAADYYFDSTFSIGAGISDSDDTDYTLRANKFFTPTVRAGLTYTSTDDADVFSIDASMRF